jgi:nitroreductase
MIQAFQSNALVMEGWSVAMNETLKAIKSRRSIRQYKEEQISDAELREIIDAALYAPNCLNQQKWHFSVIQDPDLLNRVVGKVKERLINSGINFLAQVAGSTGYNTFYKAPTVIFITGEEGANFIQLDCAMAAQNIVLAAESLNIGSCVITTPIFLFAFEDANEWKKELGIPENYGYVCTVALGYVDGEHPSAPRRNQDVISLVK